MNFGTCIWIYQVPKIAWGRQKGPYVNYFWNFEKHHCYSESICKIFVTLDPFVKFSLPWIHLWNFCYFEFICKIFVTLNSFMKFLLLWIHLWNFCYFEFVYEIFVTLDSFMKFLLLWIRLWNFCHFGFVYEIFVTLNSFVKFLLLWIRLWNFCHFEFIYEFFVKITVTHYCNFVVQFSSVFELFITFGEIYNFWNYLWHLVIGFISIDYWK